MRGIVSGAMLCAVEELGFLPCIDAIYGCSAGALNGAYCYSGDCWLRLSIYYNELTAGAFIDFRKILRGKSFIDLGYVFHDVMGRWPLDYDAIVRSSTEFHVGLTNVDALATEDVSSFASLIDLTATLRASSWMPIGSFRAVRWRGVRALDGTVLIGHPLRLAIDDGCSHILSLSTRPIKSPDHRGSPIAQKLGAIHLERIRKGLGASYLRAADEYWEERARMHSERIRPRHSPYVFDLAPLPSAPELRYSELDPQRLLTAACDSYISAYGLLAQSIHERNGDTVGEAAPPLRIVQGEPRAMRKYLHET